MEVREDDEEFQNPVDIMFENLEKKNPKHFAVRQGVLQMASESLGGFMRS